MVGEFYRPGPRAESSPMGWIWPAVVVKSGLDGRFFPKSPSQGGLGEETSLIPAASLVIVLALAPGNHCRARAKTNFSRVGEAL